MRRVFALVAAGYCGVLFSLVAADRTPVEGGGPLFRIFAGDSAGGSGGKTINIGGKKPLMVISAASDVQLSTDRKAVRLTLTTSDARKFGDVTRRHVNGLLVLEANGRVLEAMQVSSPVTNGVLQFDYPDDAVVADYLRKRFHLK